MSTYRLSMVILVFFLVCSLAGNAFAQPQHMRGFWANLTEEQRETVHNTISKMREQGASREEIHEAISELLEEYGIKVPEDWGKGHPGGYHGFNGDFWKDLTVEQREVLRATIKEMRDEGATREEIHAVVTEILEGYGIELPEYWGEGHRGFGRGFWGDLSDEQREMIRSRMREMRSQGATKEEIRAAVSELLESFGIEFPKNSEPPLIKTPTPESHITAHNYPNPFNPETYINYTLNVPGDVKIQIYNITGQVVRRFTVGYQQAGSYCVLWDGCDRTGVPVASGVYLYRIEAGPYSVMNRMMLLK